MPIDGVELRARGVGVAPPAVAFGLDAEPGFSACACLFGNEAIPSTSFVERRAGGLLAVRRGIRGVADNRAPLKSRRGRWEYRVALA